MARPLNLDPKAIHTLYYVGCYLCQEIADRLGCTRPAVYYHLKRSGRDLRSKADARRLALQRGKLDTRDGTALTTAYHHARKRRAIACDECSTILDLQIHHIDGNPYNNDPSNLQTLCHACHKRLHALSP